MLHRKQRDPLEIAIAKTPQTRIKAGEKVLVTCAATCPVRMSERLAGSTPAGQPWFNHVSPNQARKQLRERLRQIGVTDFMAYGTHDLRRGHCMDMVLAGRELHEILAAGQWKSAALMEDMQRHELECGAVMEAHTKDSDED